MNDIKILGTGCPKCRKTEQIVKQALEELGVEAKVEKVEDILEIMEYDILTTPAVVVDGEVKIKGRVPTTADIKALFN